MHVDNDSRCTPSAIHCRQLSIEYIRSTWKVNVAIAVTKLRISTNRTQTNICHGTSTWSNQYWFNTFNIVCECVQCEESPSYAQQNGTQKRVPFFSGDGECNWSARARRQEHLKLLPRNYGGLVVKLKWLLALSLLTFFFVAFRRRCVS